MGAVVESSPYDGSNFCRKCDCVDGAGHRGHHCGYASYLHNGDFKCAFCGHSDFDRADKPFVLAVDFLRP